MITIFKHKNIILFRHGITVLGISSDGDWRPLNSMRFNSNLNINPTSETSQLCDEQVYVQDTTHIGTKLRNRLLKASILLPFGNKVISVSHLKILLDNVPKHQHGLVYNDISPSDRQNFGSLEKVMQKQVLEALKQHVFDSEATIVYINICKWITSSYLDTKLKPTERISYIWRAVFVLRIWRNWILASTKYTLKEHFITENAYNCVELNAFSLLHLVIKLRNAGKPEWFLTHLFDSQPCEETFRQMRSMGTINFTKINFTLLELLHLVQRIELQNDIIFNRLANFDIHFPRLNARKKLAKERKYDDLPPNDEIISILKTAQEDAKKIALEFGINCDKFDIGQCPIHKPNIAVPQTMNDSDSEAEDHNSLDNSVLDSTDVLKLRQYNRESVSLGENSKFLELCYSDESTQIVRKSSIVWMLSESITKLSSDRLKRVQTKVPESEPKHSKLKYANTSQQALQNDQHMCKSEQISVGEWCLFVVDLDNIPFIDVKKENCKNIIIGTVLGFEYSDGKTVKQRQYHKDTAPTSKSDKNNRDIAVLSNWYAITTEAILVPLNGLNSFFVPIDKYIVTVENLKMNAESQLKLNLNSLNKFMST